MIGSTIGHYRILEKLGEGGMGVVYKAEDTRLHRAVALKFLPPHVADSAADRARFLQEARAAAALSHANICTIHGIEEQEGQIFIVMELVDGVTLRGMLPITVGKPQAVLPIAQQIGDALREAHARGVIHRDIKAENIMVTPKGQVKVMDFGLAKLRGSLKLTRTSSTLGTLAYMAPEQIQGAEADPRSDIFSFGVVLYEMLTGTLPFRGDHEAALMYSIMNEPPQSPLSYQPDLPPEMTRVIERALEKDPEDRFQHADDLVSEFRRVLKQTARLSRSGISAATVPQTAPPDKPPAQETPVPRGGRWTWMLGAAALLAIAAGGLYLLLAPKDVSVNPAMSFRTLRIPFGEVNPPSLSRDGVWVAFAANASGTSWDVYLMNTNAGEPRKITTDSSAYMMNASLSPDGSHIAYDRADKAVTKPEIAIVSSLGGFSKPLATLGIRPRWSPDGQRVAYLRYAQFGTASGLTEIRSVLANGTDDRLEIADSSWISDYCWSPEGTRMARTRWTPGGHTEIFLFDRASGEDRQLTMLAKDARSLVWTRSDDIIFSSNINGNENLWVVPSGGGTPRQITRGTGPDRSPDISDDLTRLVYAEEQSMGKVWLASLRKAEAVPLTAEESNIEDPALSPDGASVAFVQSTSSPSGWTSTLFVIDREGDSRRQLVSEPGSIHRPLWFPDGKQIAYAHHAESVSHDSSALYRIDAEGYGAPVRFGMGFPHGWQDERTLVATTAVRTWLQPVDGGAAVEFFRDSTWAEPVLGGEYVLYTHTLLASRPGVWLEPSSATTDAAVELIPSLAIFAYNPVARAVYYTTPQGALRKVSLPDGADESVGGRFPNLRPNARFSVSRDGSAIAYIEPRTVTKLVVIEHPF